MTYLIVKWVHVVSATILFGTGIGTAFFMFMANRRKDIAAIYFATRHAVIADYLFTSPAVVVQLATGLYLAHENGLPLTTGWVGAALALFIGVGLCWLPVVRLQIRMRDMAKQAWLHGETLPARYWRLDFWWVLLGSLAFPAMVAILWLMVVKPS